MSPLPPALSDEEIRRHIPAPSFDQGQHLYREGHLFNTVRRGRELEGFCESARHERYHARVTLDSDGIAADRCSCPLGTACPHVAALLLAWMQEPERFRERAPVGELLAQMSHSELLTLVQEMLRRAPELERLLDLPLLVPAQPLARTRGTVVDPERYRSQLRYALGGEVDTPHLAREIASIVEIGERFAAQGDWENARRAYQAVLDEILPAYATLFDQGEVAEQLGQAVAGLGECLAASSQEPATRRALLEALFAALRWNIDYGRVNISGAAPAYLVEHAQPEDRAELRQWIVEEVVQLAAREPEQGWRHDAWGRLLLALDERAGEVERFLKSAEEAGLYGPLFETLLRLERVSEALRVARHYLTASARDHLRAVEALEEAGLRAEALALAEQGAAQPERVESLAPWLAEQYGRQGEASRALILHQEQWRRAPSLDLYEAIRELALAAQEWEALRPTLLESLEEQHRWDLLARLHLREENWDAAWDAAQREGMSSLRLEVAQAAEADRPEWAIESYLDEAERRIRHRGVASYAVAARYLRRARDLYLETGREAEWQQRLATLRQQYRHLGAFDEQLKKVGL